MGHITRVHGPPPLEPSARPEGPVELATAGQGPPSLYLLPAALQTIQEHIGWGQVTDANVMEQGGLLIGRAYLDAETGEPFAVVEQVLEAQTASSTAASIALTHDTWADLLARFDQLPPPAAGPPWRIVGWYHTPFRAGAQPAAAAVAGVSGGRVRGVRGGCAPRARDRAGAAGRRGGARHGDVDFAAARRARGAAPAPPKPRPHASPRGPASSRGGACLDPVPSRRLDSPARARRTTDRRRRPMGLTDAAGTSVRAGRQ
jgi:hypothetical protein